MGLNIGWVKEIQFLPRPYGPVREFAWELVENSNGVLGEYTKGGLLSAAGEFCTRRGLKPQEAKTVKDWVNGLPWDEDGCVTLYFSY